jgi:hypothetical protein
LFFGGLVCEHEAAFFCVPGGILAEKRKLRTFCFPLVLISPDFDVIISFSTMAHIIGSHLILNKGTFDGRSIDKS